MDTSRNGVITIMNLYQISINPAISGDNVIYISSMPQANTSQYSFIAIHLNWSIIKSNTPCTLILDFKLDPLNNAEARIKSGQSILVSMSATGSNTVQPLVKGYITNVKYQRSINGTFCIVQFDQLLGQLLRSNSNQSWQDATQSYATIMTNIAGDQVNLIPFLNEIAKGTLLSNIPENTPVDLVQTPFTFVDGTAPPLASTLWASCEVNKNRDGVLREILFPYNRLIFQLPNGQINIQPLFLDDTAPAWDVDLSSNNNNNWLAWDTADNAAEMINRIDFQFAALLPYNSFGSNYTGGNNIYTSAFAPILYYSRITDLYNSGLFNQAQMANKALDASIFTDASLYNAYVTSIGQTALNALNSSNPVYSSVVPKQNSVPQVYASNEMAINLMQAYTVQIVYDYNAMVDSNNIFPDLPLAKVINIINYGLIDYEQMLCFDCELNVDVSSGSNLTCNFVPLKSITGTWYNKN